MNIKDIENSIHGLELAHANFSRDLEERYEGYYPLDLARGLVSINVAIKRLEEIKESMGEVK